MIIQPFHSSCYTARWCHQQSNASIVPSLATHASLHVCLHDDALGLHAFPQVWSSHSDGASYNRWWNEEHIGEGRVRKYGNSTAGEHV